MRFQKSIRICKGVRLNVSKSGVSATVGVKGISLNLGKKGVFLNTSLPGTGLSDRRKLFGGKKQTKKAQPEPLNPRDYELRAEDGEIRVLNAAGRSVSEEEARRVRRTDWFKDAQAQLNAETIDRVNAETEAVETIHHAAKRVPACGNIESEARVESRFDTFLNQLDLPVEFSVQGLPSLRQKPRQSLRVRRTFRQTLQRSHRGRRSRFRRLPSAAAPEPASGRDKQLSSSDKTPFVFAAWTNVHKETRISLRICGKRKPSLNQPDGGNPLPSGGIIHFRFQGTGRLRPSQPFGAPSGCLHCMKIPFVCQGGYINKFS